MFENFYMNIELLSENAKMPTRATGGDAGLDVYTPEEFIISPQEDILIDLKLRMEFPMGYAVQVNEKVLKKDD